MAQTTQIDALLASEKPPGFVGHLEARKAA